MRVPAQDVELIDQLPLGDFTLEIRYDRATNHAVGRVTLDGDTAKALQQADDTLGLTSADRTMQRLTVSMLSVPPGGTARAAAR